MPLQPGPVGRASADMPHQRLKRVPCSCLRAIVQISSASSRFIASPRAPTVSSPAECPLDEMLPVNSASHTESYRMHPQSLLGEVVLPTKNRASKAEKLSR